MGEPGAGAEDQATRRARKLARLRDEAAHNSDVDEAMLRRATADLRAWSVGAEGEREVAEVLTRMQRYGWTTLHDVRWPGRPQANIDHIAIGPGGIVVIDAKKWSGTVAVRDGVLRQNGYQRGRETEGVAQAAAAVTALLAPEHRTSTRAVLCLASQDQDVQSVTGVDVVGRWQLPELLLGLSPRLGVYDVADIARHLHEQLDTAAPVGTPRLMQKRRPQAAPRPTRRGAPRRASAVSGLVQLAVTLVGIWLAYLVFTNMLLGPLTSRSGH